MINLLPIPLQNKIFYFITIHPVAIAFKEDFKRLEQDVDSTDYKFRKYKWQYYSNLYRNYEVEKYPRILPYKDWRKHEYKPFIIVWKILREKRYNINAKHCIKCEEITIFNKFDKYCSVCIKEIINEYKSIPKMINY